jgi:uncharacterized protein
MDSIIKNEIFYKGIVLSSVSIHGIAHWKRVEQLGHMIADINGADKEVVSLFAYLHDARRENEYTDVDHGKRAALLLDELIQGGLVDINQQQFERLRKALYWHNRDDADSSDITVRTCWDADRLDLWRVGIIPNPELLFTDYGKSDVMINFARNLNK